MRSHYQDGLKQRTEDELIEILEGLVDRHTIDTVIEILGGICEVKACHESEVWNDKLGAADRGQKMSVPDSKRLALAANYARPRFGVLFSKKKHRPNRGSSTPRMIFSYDEKIMWASGVVSNEMRPVGARARLPAEVVVAGRSLSGGRRLANCGGCKRTTSHHSFYALF